MKILEPLRQVFGFTDQWTWIHNWVSQMPDPDMKSWVDQVVFTASGRATGTLGWADRVIWNHEMTESPENPKTCAQVYQDLHLQGHDLNSSLLNECQSDMQNSHWIPSGWDQYMAKQPQNLISLADFQKVLAAHPKLKFYLYSGGLDPYSPEVIFQDETSALGSLVTYQNFPNSGHEGFYSENEVWLNLLKDESLGTVGMTQTKAY